MPTLLGRNLTVELTVGSERRLGTPAAHQALLKFTLLPWGAGSEATRPSPQAALLPSREAPRCEAAPPSPQPALLSPGESPGTAAPGLREGQGVLSSSEPAETEARSPRKAPDPSGAAGLQSASLVQLPENHYAVQIVALQTREEIGRYMAKNNLRDVLKARIARHGQAFHVLILGIYPNLEEARQAATNLPPPLRNVTPWVRSVGSLQRAMRAAQGQISSSPAMR